MVIRIDLSKAGETVRKMADEGIAMLPNLAIAIIVFVIFFLLAKLVRIVVRRLFQKIGHNVNVGSVIGRLGEAAMIMLGLLLALPIVVPSFQAGDVVKLLGLGGVAFGFAFKDIFQNFFAGILILLTSPFRVGDQIAVKDFEGTVERIETRATLIKTYDNRRVVIPNSELFNKSVIVNTAFGKRRTSCVVGIGYEDDIDKAKKSILAAIKKIDGVLDDPPPSIVTAKLDAYTVNLNVRWWTESRRSEVVAAQDRVLPAIKHACDDADVSLPSPIREVHLFNDTKQNGQEHDAKRKYRAGRAR